MTTHHCLTCEVGWNTNGPCWNCGQPGEPGDVISKCLNRPPGHNWGPSLWEPRESA